MIVLSGSPLSTNHLYRRHGHIIYLTTEGKQRKEQYQWEAKAQWRQPMLIIPLEVSVCLYFSSKRKHDWDNFHKLSFDALSGIVWDDDSQIKTAHVYVHYDATNPRIEIDIHDVRQEPSPKAVRGRPSKVPARARAR